MKEILHERVGGPDRRMIDDVRAMRAIAHPDRLAILLYLLSGPPRTATECAGEVDATPSACSYHLRELERFGFVERAEASEDGRARPWRAAAVGFSFGGDWSDDTPASRAARQALGRAELMENQRLIERFVDAVDDMDAEWLASCEFHDYELTLTASELRELNEQIAALLGPYRAPIRHDPPGDAAAVHVVYQAFLRPDAS